MKNQDIKMQCIFATLCRGTSVDRQSNNLSIFNVIEQITLTPPKNAQKSELEKIKVVPVEYQLVTFWKAIGGLMPKTLDIQIDFIDPVGDITQSGSHAIKLDEPKGRLRTIMEIKALKVTQPGDYTVVIKAKIPGQDEFLEYSRFPLELKINS